jgi:hypothetical protein
MFIYLTEYFFMPNMYILKSVPNVCIYCINFRGIGAKSYVINILPRSVPDKLYFLDDHTGR